MRKSGVLLHISSLPSDYGIGSFGKEAYKFVDFLKKSGQYYWQILPLCPTGKGNSPYLSYSTFAGNPFFIDLDMLSKEGLLNKAEITAIDWGDDPTRVDFEKIEANRFDVLRKAYSRFSNNDAFDKFCEDNSHWLEDYSVYMTLKSIFEYKAWNNWPDEYKFRNTGALDKLNNEKHDEINFWKFVQFKFFEQWFKLKKYANDNGIHFIGDIPIYVAADSADVWANRDQFLMDEHGALTDVAGCPPDYFSKDGQLWGNPLYNWKYMKEDGYSWWISRMSHMFNMFGTVRIDHFRGFESYYCIPAWSDTAKVGEWRKGPGLQFFKIIEDKLGKHNIIAEDLGWLTYEVKQMLYESGYPGMKVLQFAFDSDENDYLLHNITENSVCYTGTHDNNTIIGFFNEADDIVKERAVNYLKLNKKEGYNWGMMRACWSSRSDTAIVTMQDILSLDEDARMNIPSKPDGNWSWRMTKDYSKPSIIKKILKYCTEYERTNNN